MICRIPIKELCCLALLVLLPFTSLADQPVLRWAADIESGAPFSFKDPKNPSRLKGFEVEIIETIAKKIHRQPVFVQNSWDGLIQGLARNDYDVVINGLEVTPERLDAVRFSRAYYVGTEKITVQKDDSAIFELAHLTKKRVGTLDGSLAFRILKSEVPGAKVIPYDEEFHAYNDLESRRIDAVLLDEPIALYYANSPKLQTRPISIGKMYYAMAFRKTDETLAQEVDSALTLMIESGELRFILERWGLWNSLVAREWSQSETPKTEAVERIEFLKNLKSERSLSEGAKLYLSFLPILMKGAALTLLLSILSMILAVSVGFVLAMARQFGGRFLVWLSVAYIEILRGTPLLIQLYLIFYGLPKVGIRLDPLLAGVLGLGLNYGACEAENYRAGLNSIPPSQSDAGAALGMNRWQIFRHILMPQAFRIVIPPMTNDFIALLKDSSLVSVITMVELTTIYGQLASTYFDYLGIGLLVAFIYFLLGLPFVRLARFAESRLDRVLRNPQRS